jgi:hypothetical protein
MRMLSCMLLSSDLIVDGADTSDRSAAGCAGTLTVVRRGLHPGVVVNREAIGVLRIEPVSWQSPSRPRLEGGARLSSVMTAVRDQHFVRVDGRNAGRVVAGAPMSAVPADAFRARRRRSARVSPDQRFE